MADVKPAKAAGSYLSTHVQQSPAAAPRKYVPWQDRIKYFSWQWHGVVTATAVVSSILHLFPYHNNSNGLKIIACILLILALVFFFFNLLAKVAKVILFPKDALTHITDPTKSSFSGFLAVGGAGLIDAAVNVIRDWHPGAHNRFLFTLYGLWWLDAAVAWFTAFGVFYFLLGQKSKDLSKIMAIWIIPAVSMIASSTCGGLLAGTLAPDFPRLALITSTFAITMGIVGLSFTTMISFGFLIRLFLHGAPDGLIALATWNILTPLGQGGFSLLINGANFSTLVPYAAGDDFPEIAIAGKLIYSVCFCTAYVFWCMGICWIMLSLFTIFRRAKKLPQFGIAWWGIVFPNGTFALLSVQLGNVLQSRFYHGFGAAWSIVVFVAWTVLMLRSIPSFVNGTMFLPPTYYLEGRRAKKHRRRHHPQQDTEKGLAPPAQNVLERSPERDDRSTLVNVDGGRPVHPEAVTTARLGANGLQHLPTAPSSGSQSSSPESQSGWSTPADGATPSHDWDITSINPSAL